MKNLLFACLVIGVVSSSFSQGVNFQHISLNEAFKLAKNQNKPLFVEIYSPTCHVCQSYEPVFADGVVANFYNQNFISIKVDVNSIDFKEYFEKKRKLFAISIPIMLFFDGNENFLHHAQLSLGQGIDMVMNQGQLALDSNKRSGTWKKKYESGNRDKNFLINYAMQTRLFRDTTANISVVNDLYKEFPKTDIDNNISWLVCDKLVMDVDNQFFQHWINNLSLASKFANGTEKEVLENIIFGSLFSSRGAKYNSEKINKINGYLALLGFSRNDITRRTILPMTKALLKEGLTARAIGDVENYTKATSPSAMEYAYLVSVFNENAKDITYKNTAMNWLKKAVSITKSPLDLAEIHYQSAKLHLKSGEKKEAEKALDLALKNAQSAKIDLKKYQSL